MARPIKPIHRVGQMVSCYQTDLDFINNHRGKMTLSSYLIEAGYHFAGETSRYERMMAELKEAKKTIQELERQLMFERSKNQKQAITTDNAATQDIIREEFYLRNKIQFDRVANENNMRLIGWSEVRKNHPELNYKNDKEMQLNIINMAKKHNGKPNNNNFNTPAEVRV